MQIAVNGKQFQIGDSLRGHIEDSVTQIAEKYFGNPIDASVTMTRDGSSVRADIAVHVGRRMTVHCQGQATDAYAAFDSANDKIDKRLRRFKRRLRDHHHGPDAGGVAAQEVVFAADVEPDTAQPDTEAEEWQPVVVAEMATHIETLTVEEAVMRLDLSNAPALMFRNSGHGDLNVVFRREDGNIGWIDPKGNAEA